MSKFGERGAIQFILLLILLAGIIGGVYLVQKSGYQLFKPKAAPSLPQNPETSFELELENNASSPFPDETTPPNLTNGTNFRVDVYSRADTDSVNLFAAKIKYTADTVGFVEINRREGQGFVKNWVETSVDNSGQSVGVISMVGGIPSPGIQTDIKTGAMLMGSIIFKTKKIGTAKIELSDSSAIYSNANNINILTARKGTIEVPIQETAPSPTPTPPSTQISCTTITVEGAIQGKLPSGETTYAVEGGSKAKLTAHYTPPDAKIEWKVTTRSKNLKDDGKFDLSDKATVNYTAPINTVSSSEGVGLRADFPSDPPKNPLASCQTVNLAVRGILQASSQSENNNSIVDEEKKVAEIDESGNISEERQGFLDLVDPEGRYHTLKQDSDETKRNRLRLQAQSITTSGVKLTPPSIDSCGEITAGGNYYFTQDVQHTTINGGVCINIHDTQDVHLDCQNHSIVSNYFANPSGISGAILMINNVKNFSVKNCTLIKYKPSREESNYKSYIYLNPLVILNSSSGTITSNTFESGYLSIENSNNLQISNNVSDASYQQGDSSSIKINNNQFKNIPGGYLGGVIISVGGENNTIVDNIIDGGWDSDDLRYKGADDGIVITGETGDLISSNTISSNYDCGIESLGLIQNTQITKNKIDSSGLCGIGAWYSNSWINNTVDSNVVDGSAYMFYFFRTDRRQDADRTVSFKNNKFINNRFLNQRGFSYIGPTKQYSSMIDFQSFRSGYYPPWLKTTLDLGNNIFKDNDFNSTLPSPILIPTNMIVDEGGNKCLPGDTSQRPLKCTTTTASPTPTPFVCNACATDINQDGVVTILDFSSLAACFNKNTTTSVGTLSCSRADINGSGRVTIEDFNCLANQFNRLCQNGVDSGPTGGMDETTRRSLQAQLEKGASIASPTPVATPAPVTGDGNNDGKINLADLSILLSDFNKTGSFRRGIDLNGDGIVNSFDFSSMRNLLIEKGIVKGS